VIPTAHLEAALAMLGLTGETTRCALSGNCMAPTLREGDTLLIRLGSRDIRVGDIVVFGSPGEFRVHRVVRMWREDSVDLVCVAADLGAALQQPLRRDQILGKVIEARGSNGRIRFDALQWRIPNRLLALRSYVSMRRHRADTTVWRVVNAIFLQRHRLFPRHGSISLMPVRLMVWFNRRARPAGPRFRPGT